ncbi:MAG: hypothetical protein FJ040_03540 [Chloroflexi bacterium]|nr:hypothetical protein [Chloroflexota bacterium]
MISTHTIIDHITSTYPDIVIKLTWGETALFYNPGHQRRHGVYFATLKDHDGANDTASHLNRDTVYRFAFGLPITIYTQLFGPRPRRPTRGHTVSMLHDFTVCNQLMPHPVYAWMGWVQILSPDATTYQTLQPLLMESHMNAQKKFARRTTNPADE